MGVCHLTWERRPLRERHILSHLLHANAALGGGGGGARGGTPAFLAALFGCIGPPGFLIHSTDLEVVCLYDNMISIAPFFGTVFCLYIITS